MTKNLAFQVPHPFKQLAIRLPNLTRGPLRLSSTLKSSLSFQLNIGSFVHSLVHIVLGYQDASITFARASTAR